MAPSSSSFWYSPSFPLFRLSKMRRIITGPRAPSPPSDGNGGGAGSHWSGESPQCDREDDDDARQQAFSWRAWLGPPKDALAFTVRTFLKLVLHRFHMQLSQYATISPPLYMREYLSFACLSFFS